jgi:tripartite-type tricarboxylate transporter receptor subunit TctC
MYAMKHSLLIAALAFVGILSSSPSTLAQSWPHRTVRTIVPFPPGSSPDIAARVFAERLGMRWKQAVVVENMPGAEGLTGTAAFAKARDDHSLLISPAAPIAVYPLVHDRLPYDPAHDIVPVVAATDTSGAIAVPASMPITTLPELVRYAHSRPGQLNWATGGGAFPILMSGFLRGSGLDLTYVPYRNQNLAIQDLVEGRIQIFATAMTVLSSLAQAGKIRVLAVTNKTRSPLWPEIPTIGQAGYPDFTFDGLIGVFAAGGAPDGLRQFVAAEIREVASDETIAQRLRVAGQIVRQGTPAEFEAAIQEQRSKLAAILRIIGNPPN